MAGRCVRVGRTPFRIAKPEVRPTSACIQVKPLLAGSSVQRKQPTGRFGEPVVRVDDRLNSRDSALRQTSRGSLPGDLFHPRRHTNNARPRSNAQGCQPTRI